MLCALRRIWVIVAVTALPVSAYAQASISGLVKDASGAVLPGVTVEAASAALIEKTRTAVTDGSGQFTVVDLRPGIYTVTFTLPGFSTVRREGIVLTGSFVVELIFQIPGLGRFFIQSAFNRDYTLVLGTVIFYATLIILFNLAVDVIQVWLNPKLRLA